MKNSDVLLPKQKKSSILSKKLSSFAFAYLLPILFSVLILFTSGYAKTTTRQGSFNSDVLKIFGIVMIVLVVIAIFQSPLGFYKKIIHPIKNKIFKNSPIYLIAIPIVLFLVLLIVYYFRGNDIKTLGHYLILVVFAFAFTLVIPFKKFAKFYNKIVLFISFFSLVVFLIMLFAGKTQYFSSTFVSRNDAYYRSILGLYFRIDVGSPRNYGPFWEPGIFSLVILTAIVFEVLFSKKINPVNLCVYIATIITTFSTSALLLLPFCLPLYFARRSKKKGFIISLIASMIVVGIIVVLGNPELIRIPVLSDVFSKLFSNKENGSFRTRLMSPLYGLYLFGKSYGLGFGPNIFDIKYETLSLFGNTLPIAQTSTIGWLFGSFGIVAVYFMSVSFVLLLFLFKEKHNLKVSIIVVLFAFVIINCEPMYTFSIFWIIFFYPLSIYVRKYYASLEDGSSLYSSVNKSQTSTKLAVSNLSWSLIIKVAALLIGLFIYPFYIKYFGNQTSIVNSGDLTTYGAVALGTWLVILQILSWILTFDIGIGNGLKNKIVEAVNTNRREDVKKLISVSYISNFVIILALLAVGLPIIFSINFNSLLNISEVVIPIRTLQLAFALAFISICLEFFLKIVLNVYQALQKQAIASLMPLISTVLLLIFVYFCRFESMSTALIAISAFYIFSVNIPLIALTIYLFSKEFKDSRPSFKEWSFRVARSVVSLGGLFFIIQMCLLIINSTNKVIISNSYGAETVSMYEPYLKIFSAICGVASAASLPIWTLILRADSLKDYQWIRKMEKTTIKIVLLFVFGSFLAAGLLQIIFNVWLGSSSFTISYFKAFMFAIWASASISSYFVSAFSNGLKILKQQIIVYGCSAVCKPLLFILIHHFYPNIDWVILIIIDAAIMIIYSVVLTFANKKVLKEREKTCA